MTTNGTEDDRSTDEQARDWVLRLASGEMDRSELDDCKAWLASDAAHRAAFERRRSVWQLLSEQPDCFAARLPAARPSAPRRVSRWIAARPGRFAGGAIAAGLAAVLVAPQIMLWAQADYTTSAEVLQVALPDGSVATLDSASAISVAFDDHERRIALLRGNAFFTVRHGDPRPFRVAALGGVTEDIGTRFEVRHGADQAAVSVAEGAVRVHGRDDAGAPGLQLDAGQAASYDKAGAITKRPAVSPSAIAAWREGELLIDGASAGEAIAAVARYRKAPTWIWADLSGGVPVSGIFRTDRADEALEALASEAGLSISWLPGGIAIITSRRSS